MTPEDLRKAAELWDQRAQVCVPQSEKKAEAERLAAGLRAMADAPQPCNCRWEGETQVQQCTLHEAHVEAIHEWAERAKTAEAELKGAMADAEPVAWGEEGWESLAWALCAEEHGEEACTQLIWSGGPIPEPWGDRWMKYEDEAKRMIALVQKHTTPQRPQWVGLTDSEIDSLQASTGAREDDIRIIESALRAKNGGAA